MKTRAFLPVFAVVVAAQTARAEEPAALSLSVGVFDAGGDFSALLGGLQYRSGLDLWIFRPHVGALATTEGGIYGYGGLLADVDITSRLVVTLSAAVGYYFRGDGMDLGDRIEFRSGGEVAWRFDDGSRLGIGGYHLSNAGLGNHNPGEESVVAAYTVPLGRLF